MVKFMKLIDTVEMMNSDDYKDRFKAEYYQLKIRIKGLSVMLDKYANGTLEFTPLCSYNLLYKQLIGMKMYMCSLEERAKIENIIL